MKRMFLVFVAVVFCLSLFNGVVAYAEETSGSSTTSWKEQLAVDKEKVKEQHQEMKTDAKTAKAEEKDLKQQIKDARAAGDAQKVAELKAKLKTLHQENVQQRKQDKQDLKAAKKQLHQDKKAAKKAGR